MVWWGLDGLTPGTFSKLFPEFGRRWWLILLLGGGETFIWYPEELFLPD